MLELKDVSKQYEGHGGEVLTAVSLTIEEGEFFSVVGPSGCGKSTLLNLVAGLEKPTQGSIRMDGKPVTGPGNDRIMMFQDSALFPWLNVIENVKFGLNILGCSREEQEERSHRYLKLVKLDKFSNYRIHELSGGMRQRVALARALAMDCRVLLMDEPFSALDKQTTNILREELAEICAVAKRTVILVTHSVEEALFLSDRVAVIGAGKTGLKRIYSVGIPRPRQIGSEEFLKLRREILNDVRIEVEQSEKGEFDE